MATKEKFRDSVVALLRPIGLAPVVSVAFAGVSIISGRSLPVRIFIALVVFLAVWVTAARAWLPEFGPVALLTPDPFRVTLLSNGPASPQAGILFRIAGVPEDYANGDAVFTFGGDRPYSITGASIEQGFLHVTGAWFPYSKIPGESVLVRIVYKGKERYAEHILLAAAPALHLSNRSGSRRLTRETGAAVDKTLLDYVRCTRHQEQAYLAGPEGLTFELPDTALLSTRGFELYLEAANGHTGLELLDFISIDDTVLRRTGRMPLIGGYRIVLEHDRRATWSALVIRYASPLVEMGRLSPRKEKFWAYDEEEPDYIETKPTRLSGSAPSTHRLYELEFSEQSLPITEGLYVVDLEAQYLDSSPIEIPFTNLFSFVIPRAPGAENPAIKYGMQLRCDRQDVPPIERPGRPRTHPADPNLSCEHEHDRWRGLVAIQDDRWHRVTTVVDIEYRPTSFMHRWNVYAFVDDVLVASSSEHLSLTPTYFTPTIRTYGKGGLRLRALRVYHLDRRN